MIFMLMQKNAIRIHSGLIIINRLFSCIEYDIMIVLQTAI